MATAAAEPVIEKTTARDSGSINEKHAHDAHSVVDAKQHEDLIHNVYDPDAIVEGSIDVTYRELDTLRHVADHINIASFLVIIVEFAERYARATRC